MTRRGLLGALLAVAVGAAAMRAADPPRRVVSMIPAVTEMIFAVGAEARLVGVSSFDRFPPAVERIPKVGGLLDPNVEAILALRPDLVVVYRTQDELTHRLERAGIPYYSYEHRGLADITATLRSVGARIGAAGRANQVASTMEADLAAIRRSVAGLPRPRTLVIFGRDPGSLRNMDASGGDGFLHDVLQIAGGDNLFADVGRQSVQVTTEMILARRPDAIIELHYGDRLKAADLARERRTWDVLSSVPAVRTGRVYILVGDEFVVPGPRIVEAARKLADTLHPDRTR